MTICFCPILGFWQKIVKEEDRLAAVVADIDHEVRIVPRGAFIRTPTGKVVPNRSYSGKKKKKKELILKKISR